MAPAKTSRIKAVLAPNFSERILAWYDCHRRRLPWRDNQDPYRIWLAEVMLQQTRVETVIPYYVQWLKQFPTIQHVASASEEAILKAWEGLGYYRRARWFHQACQTIVRDYNGTLPVEPTAFRNLPGVGQYTFAAVRSISFGDPLPAIDGNVKRIIARVLTLNLSGQRLTQQVERELMPSMTSSHPGDFNQALMDLGSAICTPREPKCSSCPLVSSCQAYQREQVTRYPILGVRKPIPRLTIAVGVIWYGNRVLICRRPTESMLGGLWEFPGGKVRSEESLEATVCREVIEEVGLKIKVGSYIGSIQHAYSHFSINLHAYNCCYVKGEPRPLNCSEVQWIIWKEIPRFAFPRANHKLFPLIEQKMLSGVGES